MDRIACLSARPLKRGRYSWHVTEASESLSSEVAATQEAASLEDIEQDLDSVDKALAALDSGDLDAAEALAAELDSPAAPTPDDDHRGGDEQEPAGPAC